MKLTIGRWDLGLRLECQVENEALKEPMVFTLSVDVFGKFGAVPPEKVGVIVALL